jgi:uroporphyrinogen III methyltransferase/synthase
VTGHARSGTPLAVNWKALGTLEMTIVVLMGVAHRGEIALELQSAGMSPLTPVLAVTWGTTPRQSRVRTTLERLPTADIRSPAVMVIGGSAGIDIDWYLPPELGGLTVVVTRGDEGEDRLVSRLRELGAEVLACPMFEIVDPSDGGVALKRAAARVGQYEWIVLSSVNAVRRLMEMVPDLRALGGTRIAAIGRSTAREIERYRVGVDLLPPRAVAESLAEVFPVGSGRVLLPRARVARDVLPLALEERGWEVEVVEAYQNVPLTPSLDESVYGEEVVVTFTSGSAVSAFADAYDVTQVRGAVAVIGPITRAAAERSGLRVTIEAETHDFEGLIEAIRRWYRRDR